jgi:hypothetical protein
MNKRLLLTDDVFQNVAIKLENNPPYVLEYSKNNK